MGVSLTRAINHAHAASPDLVEDFVIAQAPLPVRHVDFSDYAFKSRARHVATSRESLAQKAARTNSSVESCCGAALLAFSRTVARTRNGVSEPVRIFHCCYSVRAASAAHKYRISSSTSAGLATVCATSLRSRDRYRCRMVCSCFFTAVSGTPSVAARSV